MFRPMAIAQLLLAFSTLSQSLNFLKTNPLPSGVPWGSDVTRPDSPPPDTGVTRTYTFNIARQTMAPDGYVKRHGILVNNQFPGPKIEANYGDWIEVTATNNITGPRQGTSLHWHGLLQKETPWEDGVPGVSQCPIAPGKTFTYRFRADVYGTTWWHSHYSAQYADGTSGPIVIYGPSHVKYDIDLGPVLLSDWYHEGYMKYEDQILGTNASRRLVSYQNTFINGLNPYNCSLAYNQSHECHDTTQRAMFNFTSGKTHLLRIINNAANGLMKFTIDLHQMTVVTTDFTPIVPYNVSVLTLAVGQRADILVYGNGTANSAYWMRNNQSAIPCAAPGPHSVQQAKAIILYEDTPEDTIPDTYGTAPYLGGDIADPLATCKTDPLNDTVPFYPQTPPEPDHTILINAQEVVNSTGHDIYLLNGEQFRADYNEPLLFQANAGNYSWQPLQNVYNLKESKSVRIILNSNTTGPHPMHLHGHTFWVLDEGPGKYDGHTIQMPKNPVRRDTQEIRSLGYGVIQFNTDNAGVWPYHCHISTHLSTGFAMMLLEHPEKVKKMPTPMIMPETCKDWKEWTEHHFVDEIDSGI